MSASSGTHLAPARPAHAGSATTRYVVIWAVLLVALGVSLALGAAGATPVMVAIIFGVAAAKAWLVVGHFMHLSSSPRWLKVLAVSALAVVVVFYVGLVPDVQWRWAQ